MSRTVTLFFRLNFANTTALIEVPVSGWPAQSPYSLQGFFLAPAREMEPEKSGWSRISAALVENPESLGLWENLIREVELENGVPISKVSSDEAVEILRSCYDALLKKFPLLVHYWIRYAQWEFRLGHYQRAILVYERALVHLRGSIELWTSYLQFRVDTISDNVGEIGELFETARKTIGRHFYAHEFYQLYLLFIKSYATDDPQRQYHVLLRTIIEQPIYHYNLFAKMLFSAISSVDATTIGYIVPPKAVRGYSGDFRQAQIKLKKLFTDVYITTQARSHQLYSYERHLPRQYFDQTFVPQAQLKQWHNYLSFLELNFPHNHTIQVYERCVLVTAPYPEFWLRFAEFHISQDRMLEAAEVLTRGLVYCASYKLLVKLVDVEISRKNYTRARDLLTEYVKEAADTPIPVLEKILSVESLFHTQDAAVMRDLFVQVFRQSDSERGSELLLYYALPQEAKLEIRSHLNVELKKEDELNYTEKFHQSLIGPTHNLAP